MVPRRNHHPDSSHLEHENYHAAPYDDGKAHPHQEADFFPILLLREEGIHEIRHEANHVQREDQDCQPVYLRAFNLHIEGKVEAASEGEERKRYNLAYNI